MSLVEQMRLAHMRYAEARFAVLSPEHRALTDAKGWTEVIRDHGIAGIANFSMVKCLHCHYAHFLARPDHGNVIGQWVHELLLEYEAAGTAASTVEVPVAVEPTINNIL
jgi:uncharacterized protein